MAYEDAFHAGKPTDKRYDHLDQVWMVLLHLSLFLAIVVPFAGPILGPLAFLYTIGNREPVVYREGTKALNFGITISIVWMGLHLYALINGIVTSMDQFWFGEQILFWFFTAQVAWSAFRAYWRSPAIYLAIPFVRTPKPRPLRSK